MELANNKEIILVSGNLCSGKGHYCSVNLPDYEQMSVSSIVKGISKLSTRSELSTTKDLDAKIADLLIRFIEKSSYSKFVVDGIRQISIMQALQAHFGSQIKDIIWLDVPDNVAQQRFANRASAKDDQTYDDARAGDRNLGIEDVEKYIRDKHKVVPYS